jgi:predicted acylesterase/phospholipase RssA
VEPSERLRGSSYPPKDTLPLCDLVMKGGVSSGVIYPLTACELATRYRIARVGGTSAGAIAAGAVAAAEAGRSTGGYAKLAAVPDWLATTNPDGRTNLFHLFQAQPSTAPLYRLWTATSAKSPLAKVARTAWAGVRAMQWIPSVILLAIPALLLALSVWRAQVLGVVGAVILLLVAAPVAALVGAARRALTEIPANGFGVCSGMPADGADHPALTEWLTEQLNDLAGLDPQGPPLTFGHLRRAGVGLEILTTDLSTGTQVRLPTANKGWGYSADEFGRLFPQPVVDWMNQHPQLAESESGTAKRFRAAQLRSLPTTDDLPVVVAVRMSLSFPGLLSTVPLHAVDHGQPGTPIVRHRFSDGGITSNFPLQFFDRPLPGHPTFAINLVSTAETPVTPGAGVTMPDHNGAGILQRPRPIDSLPGFVGAIADTAQNWADSMQTRVPGYRDRIIAVHHTGEEGGTNLGMGSDVILGLAERGAAAGRKTVEFDFDNHRWVRLRTWLALLEDSSLAAAAMLDDEADPGGTSILSYRAMMTGTDPGSYRDGTVPAHDLAVADAIVALAQRFEAARINGERLRFVESAPAPMPDLQVRPRP